MDFLDLQGVFDGFGYGRDQCKGVLVGLFIVARHADYPTNFPFGADHRRGGTCPTMKLLDVMLCA